MPTPGPLRPPLAPPLGIPVFSLKVSAAIAGDDLPRIVPGTATEDGTVELHLLIPGPPGRSGELLTAKIPVRTFLKRQAAVEKLGGACTAHLSGRIILAGELSDTTLNIVPGRPSPPLQRAAIA